MRHGIPTPPNRTGKATASDTVQTPVNMAKTIIDFFEPNGVVLEPCRGIGNIYNQLPEPKDWCEITQGRDFLDYHSNVDWIITNPPYSIMTKVIDKFLVMNNLKGFGLLVNNLTMTPPRLQKIEDGGFYATDLYIFKHQISIHTHTCINILYLYTRIHTHT